MDSKNNMDFWVFALDDPELRQFYAIQANNPSLNYVIYIQEASQVFSFKAKQVLRLRDECMLLIDSYLVPVFFNLPLKGYTVIMTEKFCKTKDTKILLQLSFFHSSPEGIIDFGNVNDEQKKYMNLLVEEYHHPYDDMQPPMLRNLIFNILLLSPTNNYNIQLKSGHLLSYALQFMELTNEYAFHHMKKAFYADKIGITEEMLTRALRVTYQKTFREIITCKVLVEGIKNLICTNKSITQIAHELNYDASDFNKLFLQWKGLSPTDIRTNYQKLISYAENTY